jgi:hypothetical protein
MFKFLSGMLVMAAIVAWLTNPGMDEAEAELKRQVFAALESQSMGSGSGLDAAALLACRVSPEACYDLVRTGIDITHDNRYIYSRFDLTGFGREAKCYAIFTKFFCPGGMVGT